MDEQSRKAMEQKIHDENALRLAVEMSTGEPIQMYNGHVVTVFGGKIFSTRKFGIMAVSKNTVTRKNKEWRN
jgi:hypothetical protein